MTALDADLARFADGIRFKSTFLPDHRGHEPWVELGFPGNLNDQRVVPVDAPNLEHEGEADDENGYDGVPIDHFVTD